MLELYRENDFRLSEESFVASDAKGVTDLFLQILSGVVGILHGADAYLSFVHYKTGR
jgi:hypothetical protein